MGIGTDEPEGDAVLNILTKISVVFLVVASLVAMPVFINLAVAHANYKQLYLDQKEAYKRLEAVNTNRQEQVARLTADLGKARSESNRQETVLKSRIDDLQREKTQLRLQLASTDGKLDNINLKMASLSESLKTEQGLVAKIQGQLDDAWKDKTRQQKELIRMGELLKEERARADRLAKNSKVLREQAEDMKNTIEQLNDSIASTGQQPGTTVTDDQALPAAAEQKITGTITAIQNNLASVNIGSAHGVRSGMKLIVYRGDQFVGNLMVEQVRVNESAGVVTDKRLSPQQGDKVTSSLATH
jgi:myosin heavy subunit